MFGPKSSAFRILPTALVTQTTIAASLISCLFAVYLCKIGFQPGICGILSSCSATSTARTFLDGARLNIHRKAARPVEPAAPITATTPSAPISASMSSTICAIVNAVNPWPVVIDTLGLACFSSLPCLVSEGIKAPSPTIFVWRYSA